MLPVLLNVPPAALPAPGAPLMRVNGDGCAKTKGKHAQHVVQQEAVAAPTETADELVSHVAALKFDACDRSPSLVAPLPNVVCPRGQVLRVGLSASLDSSRRSSAVEESARQGLRRLRQSARCDEAPGPK
jgi:hypothetical protein